MGDFFGFGILVCASVVVPAVVVVFVCVGPPEIHRGPRCIFDVAARVLLGVLCGVFGSTFAAVWIAPAVAGLCEVGRAYYFDGPGVGVAVQGVLWVAWLVLPPALVAFKAGHDSA